MPGRCYLPSGFHAMDTRMGEGLTVLGLESSCDDTAAAVVHHAEGQSPEILSSVVFGQAELHDAFGGVVPEIAARAHAEKLDVCAAEALKRADMRLGAADAIAVTAGPGLIGGVISGVMCAKGLAAGAGLPLVGVNHLAGHALTPRLTDGLDYPYLMLLVSGGHCQFLIVRGCNEFKRLGGTIDDAPGEAFDKVARLLGLPQPGGPAVEAEAARGDPERFNFPRPLLDRPGCDMSFSGLKTALREVMREKTRRALDAYFAEHPPQPALAVAGGVAANTPLREALKTLTEGLDTRFVAPPLPLCTDNAAMIAYAGIELFRAGHRDDMSLAARPRWPLDTAQATMLGHGKKGAKA